MPDPFMDLLGRPFSALTCSGLVAEVLRRMGLEVPAGALPCSEEEAWTELQAPGAHWEKVADALGADLAPGDVVLTENQDGSHHVSVCVERGWIMSSSKSRGVYRVPTRALSRVLGVYRLGVPA